jgi:uncharacterized protein (UPF0335 family)
MDGSQMDTAYRISASELRSFIERVEKLRAEQADLKEVEREIFAEAKGRGYMTRPIRTLIKERATDPDKRAEDEAVLEMYRSALGMD